MASRLRLRIQRCHLSGLGSSPGPGTSTYHGCIQKQTNKKKTKERPGTLLQDKAFGKVLFFKKRKKEREGGMEEERKRNEGGKGK